MIEDDGALWWRFEGLRGRRRLALCLVLLLPSSVASLCCLVFSRVCLAVLAGVVLVCPCCPLLRGWCEGTACGPVEDDAIGVVGCGWC